MDYITSVLSDYSGFCTEQGWGCCEEITGKGSQIAIPELRQ
jgi:hypothetical protein